MTAVLPDAAARHRARTDLTHTLAVDAGAGTGKTTVLIDRMMELIAGGCPLRQIAAITFTEKAAGELKQKLRAALELQLAGENPPRDRFHDALADLDRAQVSTIHAFCAALLYERPAEARVDPNFGVLDELGAFVLRHRVWRRWIAGECSGGGALAARALTAEPSLLTLQRTAEYLLENRDLQAWLPAPVAVDRTAWLAQLNDAVDTLRQLQRACTTPDDRAARQIDTLAEALATLRGADEAAFDEAALALAINPNAGNRANWHQAAPLARVKEVFRDVRDAHAAFRSTVQHNRCCDIVAWLRGYVAAYEAAKQRRGVLDFADLLIKARDLLRDDLQVRGHFQRRFRALLVDEFQDTDPLQTEIVFFLAERHPRTCTWHDVELAPGKLFLVGDPKQSIYRFRRADIELYADAKRTAASVETTGAVLDLQTNFRSRHPLIRWFNGRFAALIHAPGAESYQPAYVPLAPSPMLPDEGEPAVHLLSVGEPSCGSAGETSATKSDRLHLEARVVAAHLRALIAAHTPVRDRDGRQRPVAFGDIALLFRDNEPMHVYEDALRERAIPYRITGGKRFYGREEISAVLALIRCVANPKDAVSLVATLRGAFFGFSDEQLFLFKDSGGRLDYTAPGADTADFAREFRAAFALLDALHRRSRAVGPAALLDEALRAVPHVLPLFYLKPQGDQRVANLLKLIDTARALEADDVHSLRGLARFLDDLEALEAEEAESPVADETDDVVRLLTIHKAKGLEFPVVVLADGTRALNPRLPVGIVNRNAGELALRIGGARSANWERLAQWEKPRSEAEEIRLLYVAATRARDWLLLPQHAADARGEFLAPLLAPTEHARVVDTAAYDVAPRPPVAFRVPGVPDAAPDPDVVAAQHQWDADRARQIDRASRAPIARSATEIAHADAPAQGAFVFGRRHGAQIGTLVHAVLQRIDLHDAASAEALAAGLAAGRGGGESDIAEAAALARTALALPVLARARRADSVQREVPFTWSVEGQMIEGVIDLLFRERDEVVIVDYKTDDVDRGRDLDERVAHYRSQAVLYAAAIETITQQPVKEVVLAFLRPGVEKRLRVDWRADAQGLLQSSSSWPRPATEEG